MKRKKNGKKMKKDVRAISSLHLWEKLIFELAFFCIEPVFSCVYKIFMLFLGQRLSFLIKFMFSKKATYIDKIFAFDLMLCSKRRSTVKILSIFVAFLENMNFNICSDSNPNRIILFIIQISTFWIFLNFLRYLNFTDYRNGSKVV